METLFEFWEDDPTAVVKTGQVAKALKVSPASATEMVQRLAGKGLVDYQLYKGLRLTEEGLEVAKRMKKRHRLAECLLIDVMNYQGEAHQAACMLEHAFTDELEETLDHLLGRPSHDPTGRPIPKTVALDVDLDLSNMLVTASALGTGVRAKIFSMVLSEGDKELLASSGLECGAEVVRTSGGIISEGVELAMDERLLKRILVKPVD